jgi:hypothetical protein
MLCILGRFTYPGAGFSLCKSVLVVECAGVEGVCKTATDCFSISSNHFSWSSLVWHAATIVSIIGPMQIYGNIIACCCFVYLPLLLLCIILIQETNNFINLIFTWYFKCIFIYIWIFKVFNFDCWKWKFALWKNKK